jgi:hypothetical protein
MQTSEETTRACERCLRDLPREQGYEPLPVQVSVPQDCRARCICWHLSQFGHLAAVRVLQLCGWLGSCASERSASCLSRLTPRSRPERASSKVIGLLGNRLPWTAQGEGGLHGLDSQASG